MSVTRSNAIKDILHRKVVDVDAPSTVISKFFGTNTFDNDAMKQYMAEDTYLKVKKIIQTGEKLGHKLADEVADAMKHWAMAKGATHYAHWFQPWTGRTAEKHDSFFTTTPDGKVLEEFGGSELAQQEPDGSSFPGGGLRSTFEARGYTAWDPSSPAFIIEVGDGKTLCIPTILVTYSGEALDYKLPLLKSQSYLEKAAISVCQYFDKKINKVTPTLGWEQEYFLVDEALFNTRPDLVMTGRTLVGRLSSKGQHLDDHYFGAIPDRVYAYMRDLETECHKLGIPVRTRHNEVAPGQYELAPMYEEVNVAVDHNQLLMDLMERIAKRHKLCVLLHEKPFAGVNGSGKHNNWSMATNTGKNLLSPGKYPGTNLQFLTFFVNTIAAVYEYADLLRASVASASNDHRLGANEAPPAIVSVFIGETLTKVLDDIEAGHDISGEDVARVKDLLSKIPDLKLDNTDRNRTSPFAFTGNKFEIRMVGSTFNCAASMTVMNTIVGKQLRTFQTKVDQLVENGTQLDVALLKVIKELIVKSKPIRFEGDNYSDEWKEEAASRGLSNFPNTPEALDAYVSDKVEALFTESGVFSKKELHAHHEVLVENYITRMQIECRTLMELCSNGVMPASIDYQSRVVNNALGLQELGFDKSAYKAQLEMIQEMANHINGLKSCMEELKEKAISANQLEPRATALGYSNTVKPLMEAVRIHTDKLEYIVDDRDWPFAKYRELLFIK